MNRISKNRIGLAGVWSAIAVLGTACGSAAYADTYYLFASDRDANGTRSSGIHRYIIDSDKPGQLTPAPSAGQPDDNWGESAGKPFANKKLAGIAVGPNGDVYAVCPEIASVVRFDGQTGAYKGEVVKGLDAPDGLAFGPDGNLYVTSNISVLRYSPEGKPLPGVERIGATFTEGPLRTASGLTFGPDGNLYVASQLTATVSKFDGKTGRFLDLFCASNFSGPSEIAFGPDGNLYIASSAGPRFDKDSGYVAKFDGVTGQFLGRFAEARGPLSLDFGPNNDVFVTSYWSGKITRYDAKTGADLGIVREFPAGNTPYYIAIAKQEEGPKPKLAAYAPKVPRLTAKAASVDPTTLGPETIKGWQSGLRPKGVPGPWLTLAQNKKTEYSIALPAKASTQDRKAAAVLVGILEQMTGAVLPIMPDGHIGKPGAKIISIGRTALLKKANLPQANVDLKDEGYAIAAKGSNLYLWGGKARGAIYAVYSLLEEDLNCRWYSVDSARVPRTTKLTFRPTVRHFVPRLVVRDPYYFEAFNADWSLRNKTQSSSAPVPVQFGGFAKSAIFVHSYNYLIPPEKYFATHPEYFALVNGKRNAAQLDLSNPDVLRIMVEEVKRNLREQPDAKFISVSPNDGRGYCECPICSALDKAEATVEGSKTGSLIAFVNKVAEAIEPEFPDVKVSTLAYLDTFMPPKTIRPHKNVVIQLCTDSHAWKYQFDFITESEQFQTAMKAWHAIGAQMYIWDYTTDFVHYPVVMPNMPVVTPNIKFFLDHGARGVMLQGSYQSEGGENAQMRSWVWAKQLWDPSLDTRALMKDFIYGYFGTAGEPIWNYNMMLWQIWEKNHAIPHKPGVTKVGEHPFIVAAPCSMPPDWEVFSPEFLKQTRAYMEKAESLAKDPQTKQRVRIAKLPLIYIELGQGLGYIEELGGYHSGTWVENPDPKEKARYQNLLREFIDITTTGHVTAMAERVTTDQIVAKWQTILGYDKSKVAVLKLNPVWKFRPDSEGKGTVENWQAVQVNDADWADVRTDRSNGWESQGFKDYRGTAWYRQTFTLPADYDVRKHLFLLFNAVDSESEIYINGQKAYDHTLASTGLTPETIWNHPFSFDPRPFLKPGEANTIAVKVTSAGGVRGVWRPAAIFSSDAEMTTTQLMDASIMTGM